MKNKSAFLADPWELFELSDIDKALTGESRRWSNRRLNEYKTCKQLLGGSCPRLQGFVNEVCAFVQAGVA